MYFTYHFSGRVFLWASLWLSLACAGLAGCEGGGTGGNAGAGAGAASNEGGSAGGGAGPGGLGGTVSPGGAGGTSGSGGTGGSGGAGGVVFVEAMCQNHTYLCGNTIDDDGDGLTDWQDPDCLGPCDNTEDSLYGGIPGTDPVCTADCYFDSDSGTGNDECHWNYGCDPNEVAAPGHPQPSSKCPYDPNVNTPGTDQTCDQLMMEQTEVCANVCGPLTPNGCDCFGCCELPAGTGKFVFIGSIDEDTGEGACTIEALDDPSKCEPCLPVPSCLNSCEKCEKCIGKPELPPECDEGTSCPPELEPCDLLGSEVCPADHYCITGCCVPIDPIR
jgi:hypothetical protein